MSSGLISERCLTFLSCLDFMGFVIAQWLWKLCQHCGLTKKIVFGTKSFYTHNFPFLIKQKSKENKKNTVLKKQLVSLY